ncbi:MAG: putative bifunctional diguanylate cyclase/phosphodiesterase [Gammaproteobacteria bacterium]
MNLRRPETSLSLGVGLGFTVVLLLLIALTTVGLVQMADINQRMEYIAKENNVKVALAHEMKDSLRDRAVITHTITLLTDPFEQNLEYDAFHTLGGAFMQARDQLEAMPLRPQEAQSLSRIRALGGKTQPLVIQAVEIAMKGKSAEAREILRHEVIPAQKLIALEINELLRLQQQETDAAVTEATTAYRNTRMLMMLFGGAAALIGLAIAVVVIRNASRQAQSLQHQAMFDNLTNLPNRALFSDRLQQAILVGRREKQAFALIAMDLDRFKEINDSLGHHVGDQVLAQIASRTRACLRESDTVARMGGDEFTLLLPTVTKIEGAEAVAKKILAAFKEPMNIGGRQLDIGASLGIAMFPQHGEDADKLLREADVAMYDAKRSHGGFKVYSPELDQNADDRLMLQTDLRRAIANDQLVLHYQPKIDFHTDRISGVEALVRWQHPTHGLISPDKFIPLAEASGLIKPLTYAVLRMALRQCEVWDRDGLPFSVAVNISAINIQDPEFPDQVAVLLKEAAVPATRLELEVTETAVMTEPVRAVECIKKLRTLGVQVAIDDFGTGYSSMAYLKELLVAKIKIDKSFVKDMVANHHDAVIVRSTVELGHNLGMKVIAEGVENQVVWDKLKALGCDSAQGYYMGRPVAADKFIEWLRQSRWGMQPRHAPTGAASRA